jgi:hypothetical protein
MKCKKDLKTPRGFCLSNERSSISSVPVDIDYYPENRIEDKCSLIAICGDPL